MTRSAEVTMAHTIAAAMGSAKGACLPHDREGHLGAWAAVLDCLEAILQGPELDAVDATYSRAAAGGRP